MSKVSVKARKRSDTPRKGTSGTEDRRREVTFRSDAQAGSRVYVAGSFNGWDPKEHELSPEEGGGFSTTLLLDRGTHQYKFIINDVWCVDPGCVQWAPNGVGSLNSVLSIL